MEPFEYVGMWWLPQRRESPVAGTLKYSSDAGLRLHLIGSLTEESSFSLSLEDVDLICGVVREREPFVTLRNCSLLSHSSKIPGFVSQEWMPRDAFIGHSFDSTDQLVFSEVSVAYTRLAPWLRTTGLSVKTNDGKTVLAFESPTMPTISIPGGELSVVFRWDSSGDLLRSVTLRQDPVLTVKLENPMTLEAIRDAITFPLMNLLTFATGIANSVLTLEVRSEYAQQELSSGKTFQLPLAVAYHQIHYDTAYQAAAQPRDMLFTFRDIDPHDLFPRWLRISNELRGVFDLFFSLRYGEPMYSEHRFLNLAFACDAYHRLRISRDRIPLNDRLCQMFDRHRKALDPVIPDAAAFAKEIAAVRNGLAHGISLARTSAGSGMKLRRLTEGLTFLLQCSFLGELKLPPEQFMKGDRTYVARGRGST